MGEKERGWGGWGRRRGMGEEGRGWGRSRRDGGGVEGMGEEERGWGRQRRDEWRVCASAHTLWHQTSSRWRHSA